MISHHHVRGHTPAPRMHAIGIVELPATCTPPHLLLLLLLMLVGLLLSILHLHTERSHA